MSKFKCAVLVLLVLACQLWAELKITGDTKVKRDRIVRLSAEGAAAGSALVWDVSNEDAVDAEEVGAKYLFSAPPGVYKVKVRAIALVAGKTVIETARATVTVGDTDPPPGPGPGPGPNPTDPTAAAVIAAYATETDTAKASQVATLAALYRQMALKLNDPISVTTLATVGQLAAVFKAAQTTLGITPTMLPKTRRVIADYLNPQIGTVATAQLDRAKAAAAFTKVADCLATLKGAKK